MPADEAQREAFAALKSGDTKRVVALMQANPGLLKFESALGTWLHVAARFGRLDSVRCLVELGLDVNHRGGTFNGGAVHEAASAGFVDIVNYLIDHGAELDESQPERNPLWGAIYGGHRQVVELLVARGMNPTIRYSGDLMDRMSAYDFAVERGHHDIAAMLTKQ